MNILYINHYAGSIEHGMEFRPYYLAKEWEKLGHKVRIVAADFSHLRTKNPTIEKDFEKTYVDGIEYQWIHTAEYQGNGVKRAITMIQFCTKLFFGAKKIIRDFKPDIVITSSTYPLDTYPAQRIAKISKVKYIHEGHDIWPLTLTELMGMPKWNPLVVLFAIAEKSAYKKSNKVVSLLPQAYKHMLTKGLQSKDKFTNIPNGIVLEDWENPADLPEEHKAVFEKLKEDGKKIVCYLGGHAPSNSLDVLIDAAKQTENEKIAYVLIGKGSQKEELMKKAEGCQNVIFLPPVTKLAVPTALALSDFLYIGAQRCSLYKFGVSMNKVYDYMMAGKPIIYGVEASNNDVADADCGITIEPDNAKAIVNAVETLAAMTGEELEAMGRRGHTAVKEKYNYEVLAKRFAALME